MEGRASVTEPKLKSILRGGKVRNEEIQKFSVFFLFPGHGGCCRGMCLPVRCSACVRMGMYDVRNAASVCMETVWRQCAGDSVNMRKGNLLVEQS